MSAERNEGILKRVDDDDVAWVQLWFTDVRGDLRTIEVPRRRLPSVMAGGAPVDGSFLSGRTGVEETDNVALPDWDTLTVLPRVAGAGRTAFVFCDLLDRDRRPHPGDPRGVLKRQLARAAAAGLDFQVGPELEYFYFGDPRTPAPSDGGGSFDVLPDGLGDGLRRQTVSTLEGLGVPVEASHHEAAPSQHELDLHYDSALVTADRLMLVRQVVRRVAADHGVHATFMPKPLRGHNGSSMHVNQSLFRGEVNAFYSEIDADLLSELGRGYVAGQLAHVREFTSVLNQHVNSYKRLVPGFEAPTSVSWAHRNRTALIRIPHPAQGKEESVRVELRTPDPAANPYLALAVMLAAGLEGIEKGYPLPPAVEADVSRMSAAQRAENELPPLPDNLFEAVGLTQRSELVRRALGDHVFEQFVTEKLAEWHEYREQVTTWEVRRHRSAF